MTSPVYDFSFARKWNAEILAARPVILPARHFVYPGAVEEVERGALEVLVRPEAHGSQPFLATCALGFRDAAVPTGIWSAPNPAEICAVSGGYAYLIDTAAPDRFCIMPYRPVLQVIPVAARALLLFVGNRTILAWGSNGPAWESSKLSDEGITSIKIEEGKLRATGWNMLSDKETVFTLDLASGRLLQP